MTNGPIVLATMIALLPAAARAQDAAPTPPPSLAELSRRAVVPPALELPRRSTRAEHQPEPRRKDSLLNGILIGAGLGALAGAAISTAAIECDVCTGFNVPLTFGIAGAAAGAGIGAALDALLRVRRRMPDVTAPPADRSTRAKERRR